MSNLLLLIGCFIGGILLRRFQRMPDTGPATLNSFIIHISLPALTLLHIHRLTLSENLWWTGAMPWLIFGVAAILFRVLAGWMRLEPLTTGALILTAGLGNTSFVGVPMVGAYFGDQGLPTAIVADQLGSFLVLSILGIPLANLYGEGGSSWAQIPRRILKFPPFIALVVALLLRPLAYPDWWEVLLMRLGDTLAPLALVSVGMQLKLGEIAAYRRELALGLGFKLILAPLMIYLLYIQLLGFRGLDMQVTLFEAAMPPMITAAIVASEHRLNPPLANLMVAIGIPLSFVTLHVWWLLLSQL